MPTAPPAAASRAIHAAFNNAAWCSAVCSAHGHAGQWSAAAWWTDHPAPPYYPNLVTLDPGADAAALADRIGRLRAGLGGRVWAVKDSFHRLDLHGASDPPHGERQDSRWGTARLAQGLDPLFDARWLWHDGDEAASAVQSAIADWTWQPITDERRVQAWEAAWWRAADPGADPAGRARLFPAALLARDDIHIVAACRGSEVVAGFALCRSGEGPAAVAGIACTFHPQPDSTAAWSAFIAAARRLRPGLPLVGYESGAAADAAQRCGFADAGPLRVWLHTPG